MTREIGREPPSPWTLIVRAKGEGPEAEAALEQLIRSYFGFLIWLIRVNRHPPDTNAEELANEYLLGVLRRKDLTKLDRCRGSFHGWLRVSVKRFLFNQWDAWRIRARSESMPFEAIDDSRGEENLCDHMFMAQLLARALELTREQTPDQERFPKLVRFLPGPQADFAEQAELAAELGLRPNTLRKAVHDLRARFERNVDALFREAHDFDPDDPPSSPGGASALLRDKRALLACLEPFRARAVPVLECPS